MQLFAGRACNRDWMIDDLTSSERDVKDPLSVSICQHHPTNPVIRRHVRSRLRTGADFLGLRLLTPERGSVHQGVFRSDH